MDQVIHNLVGVLDQVKDRQLATRAIQAAVDQLRLQLRLEDLEATAKKESVNTHPPMTVVHGPDPMLTSEEACQYLKCGRTYLVGLHQSGLLKISSENARKHLYRRSSLDAFLAMDVKRRNLALHRWREEVATTKAKRA